MRGWRAALLLVLLPVMAGAAAADDAEQWPVGNAWTMWEDPYIIGSYRHWKEIYPVRVVEAGTEQPLPYGPQLGPVEFWGNGEKLDVESYLERARVTGLLVIKNGEIRLEAYGNGGDQDALFTSNSVAKSVTSTLVGVALGQGLIDSLDDPVDKYIPELADTAYAGVPIEAVLQMSSGVAFVEDYDSALSDSDRLWIDVAARRTVSAHAFLMGMTETETAPYRVFNYKGTDTQALAWLIERVTGKTLSAYLSETIWNPVGMEADALWGVDDDDLDGASEIAFAALNARLRDFGRFGLLIARDGVWNGNRILPEGWVERATTPSSPQVMPGRLYQGYKLGYQYQWWVYPDGTFTAQGINGQFIYVDRSRDLVVVQTAGWSDWWDTHLEHMFEDFVRKVAQMTDAE